MVIAPIFADADAGTRYLDHDFGAQFLFQIKHRQSDIQYPALFWSRFDLARFDALAAAIFEKFACI